MFWKKKKNSWALELSGKKITSPSWSVIQSGLMGLQQTDEDSYLTLIKNPGESYEQFLQTALPDISSGLPPVYSVQTAEGYGETLKQYEIEMPQLDDVIAFFKRYYDGMALDLSQFSPMPLWREDEGAVVKNTFWSIIRMFDWQYEGDDAAVLAPAIEHLSRRFSQGIGS